MIKLLGSFPNFHVILLFFNILLIRNSDNFGFRAIGLNEKIIYYYITQYIKIWH